MTLLTWNVLVRPVARLYIREKPLGSLVTAEVRETLDKKASHTHVR